ncbi:MAG: peptide chain release factor N(5)-glutamine methyltransferase [Ferruginibacter sp.]
MTVKEIYTKYTEDLRKIYPTGEAVAITKIVLEHFAKISPTDVATDGKKTVETTAIEEMNVALSKLMNYMPVQYITGKAWFYNLCFTVTNAVLIPRPETEELVLEVIQFLKKDSNKEILDIGTGSGCIPISIKKNVPTAQITALDISLEALAIAKKNATNNNVVVNFLQLDFLKEGNYISLPKYDVIISNPPYIPENEKISLDRNVTMNEPHLALFVPENDPLIFYKKIKIFAEKHLVKEGRIFLEVHEDFAKDTADIFTRANYEVMIKKDMQGKQRMLLVNHFL